MHYSKAYRMAKKAARPPLRSYLLKGMSVPLALADFSLMYELANLAFDSEGAVGLLLAVSVTAATIALPMLSAQLLRSYMGKGEGEADRLTLALAIATAVGFAATAVGVFWFRMQFEGQSDALVAAGSGSALGIASSQDSEGGAVSKSILLLIIMVSTGIVTFGNSYVQMSGPKAAVRALAVLREHQLQWEVEGELAAEQVMREEPALMDEERAAVDAVTDATVALENDLLELRNVVDPAQAQIVEQMLRKIAESKIERYEPVPELMDELTEDNSKSVGKVAQTRAA